MGTCKSMAKIGGQPDKRFAILPHPMGSLPEAILMERARSAAEQFVDIATGE